MFYRFFEALRTKDIDRDRCSPMKIKRDSIKTPTTMLDVKSQVMILALQTLTNDVDLNLELSHWVDHLP